MYLAPLKAMLTHAVRNTFDQEYPVEEFRGLHTSIEYPMKEQHYPGCWVDFVQIGSLQRMGVGHVEYSSAGTAGAGRRYTRWRYQGEASFSLAAMTSLERDRLHDEFIRVLAFGPETEPTGQFRKYIEDNDLIACNFDFDEITVRGTASTLGTPWATDDLIYEVEVAMECFGEFLADHQSRTLLPFSAVKVYPYVEGDTDPTTPDEWIYV